MSRVFREMIVEWDGEKYNFTPSNRFLRRVDREVSLSMLAERADRGDVPVFDMAFVIAEILREAGVETDEDAVLALITDETDMARAEYLTGLLNDIMPSRDVEPAVKKSKPKAKGKR